MTSELGIAPKETTLQAEIETAFKNRRKGHYNRRNEDYEEILEEHRRDSIKTRQMIAQATARAKRINPNPQDNEVTINFKPMPKRVYEVETDSATQYPGLLTAAYRKIFGGYYTGLDTEAQRIAVHETQHAKPLTGSSEIQIRYGAKFLEDVSEYGLGFGVKPYIKFWGKVSLEQLKRVQEIDDPSATDLIDLEAFK